jgi:hypothetical protein
MQISPQLEATLTTQDLVQKELRALLANGHYAELDTRLIALQTAWQGGAVYAEPDYEMVCFDNYLFARGSDTKQQIALVEQWVKASPRSYHAHTLLGELWSNVGTEIRGTGWASSVSPAMWQGAHFARDKSCAYLLHAMTLSPQPAFAYTALMRITAYLGEPDWLEALFQGEPSMPYEPPTDADERAVWDEGVRLYQQYTQELPIFPRALPPQLPPRQAHEMKEGRLYWLQQAVACCPRNILALRTATYYLYPRWFGDHEQMAAFINGPMCAALSDVDRGVLWRTKELDELEDYPDSEDKEGVAAYAKRWDALIARPAPTYVQIANRLQYAKFLSYVEEIDRSYAQFQQAAQLYNRGEINVAYGENEMRNLWIDVLDNPARDQTGVLHLFCTARLKFSYDCWSQLVCAWGYKNGVAGFPQDEAKAAQLIQDCMQRSAQSSEADDQHTWDYYNFLENVWNHHGTDPAMWLANTMVAANERTGKTNAPLLLFYNSMYNNNLRRDTPEAWQNAQTGQECLRRAAASGHPRSRMLYAVRVTLNNEYQNVPPAAYNEAKHVFYETMQAGESDSKRYLFYLMIDSGGKEDQAWAHDNLTAELLDAPYDEEQYLTMCRYMADIYHRGAGAPAMVPLARAWALEGLEISPNDAYLKDVAAQAKATSFTGLMSRLSGQNNSDAVRKALEAGKVFAPPDFEI